MCAPQFSIKDANGEIVLRIEGPFCTYSICGDVEFNIMTADGATEIGKISKQWSGLLKEAFTDADNFGINFPIDLVSHLFILNKRGCLDRVVMASGLESEGRGVKPWHFQATFYPGLPQQLTVYSLYYNFDFSRFSKLIAVSPLKYVPFGNCSFF